MKTLNVTYQQDNRGFYAFIETPEREYFKGHAKPTETFLKFQERIEEVILDYIELLNPDEIKTEIKTVGSFIAGWYENYSHVEMVFTDQEIIEKLSRNYSLIRILDFAYDETLSQNLTDNIQL